MAEKIKAAVLLGKKKSGEIEIDMPECPKGGCIVKSLVSGYCGTDQHILEFGFGPHPIACPTGIDSMYPLLLGHEFCGEVVEIGPEVDLNVTTTKELGPLKVGDIVSVDPVHWPLTGTCGKCFYCTEAHYDPVCESPENFVYGFRSARDGAYGGWAQYVKLEPGTVMFKWPKGTDPKFVMLHEPTDIGMRVVEQAIKHYDAGSGAMPTRRQTLYILGAGTQGLTALLCFRLVMPYAKVVQCDFNDHRLEMAKKLGADIVLNASKTTFDERLAVVHDLTTGHGADLGFDCTGKNADKSFLEVVKMIRRSGTMVIMGNYTPGTAGLCTFDPGDIVTRALTITSIFNCDYNCFLRIYQAAEWFKKAGLVNLCTNEWTTGEVAQGFVSQIKEEGIKHCMMPNGKTK